MPDSARPASPAYQAGRWSAALAHPGRPPVRGLAHPGRPPARGLAGPATGARSRPPVRGSHRCPAAAPPREARYLLADRL